MQLLVVQSFNIPNNGIRADCGFVHLLLEIINVLVIVFQGATKLFLEQLKKTPLVYKIKVAITLKSLITTKFGKKGKISSILTRSHFCKMLIALKI
jgi:hypothetical protein